MKAYKGFDKDLKCGDFQYEVGGDTKKPAPNCVTEVSMRGKTRWIYLSITRQLTEDIVKLNWMRYQMKQARVTANGLGERSMSFGKLDYRKSLKLARILSSAI